MMTSSLVTHTVLGLHTHMQADLLHQITERDTLVESLQAQLQQEGQAKGAAAEAVHAELLNRLHEKVGQGWPADVWPKVKKFPNHLD
jgi:hypothetical protein